MLSWRVVSVIVTGILLLPISTDAQQRKTKVESEHGSRWVVGGGVGAAPDFEGSEDYEAVPLFVAQWLRDDGVFFEALPNEDIGGLSARLNFIGGLPLMAGPIINYRARRNDVDNNEVDNLDSVGTSWEMGGFIGFNWEGWNVAAQFVHDVADGHDGGLISLGGGYASRLGGGWKKWNWGIRASTSWASDNYMDSYFSVKRRDALASNLEEYEAEKGFKDVGFGLTLGRQFYENWRATGSFSYKRLLSDAKDSPVVDDAGSKNQFGGGLVVSYEFAY